MKVVLVEPGKAAEIRDIPEGLESYQNIVGGMIEQVCPWEDEVALICNENGKNEGLPYNRGLYDEGGNILDIIAGTFFIVGLGEENYRSLTDTEAKIYRDAFLCPEDWGFYDTAWQKVREIQEKIKKESKEYE